MNKMYLYIVAGMSFFGIASVSAQTMSLSQGTPEEISLRENKLVVLKFWMNGCPSCVSTAVPFERVSKEFDQQVIFMNENIHAHREYITKENVRTVPTILFYKNGKVVGRTGSTNYTALRNLVVRYGGF